MYEGAVTTPRSDRVNMQFLCAGFHSSGKPLLRLYGSERKRTFFKGFVENSVTEFSVMFLRSQEIKHKYLDPKMIRNNGFWWQNYFCFVVIN